MHHFCGDIREKLFLSCLGWQQEEILTSADILLPPYLHLGQKTTAGGLLQVQALYCTSTHCNENHIYVFPEKELHGLGPNFHIHLTVSDLYWYSQERSTYFPAAE
jgi:hypothetical protein